MKSTFYFLNVLLSGNFGSLEQCSLREEIDEGLPILDPEGVAGEMGIEFRGKRREYLTRLHWEKAHGQ